VNASLAAALTFQLSLKEDWSLGDQFSIVDPPICRRTNLRIAGFVLCKSLMIAERVCLRSVALQKEIVYAARWAK